MNEPDPDETRAAPYVIGVVIPAFDAAAYLPAALESVAAQRDDGAFELDVVVVDDGSTDGTSDVVRRASPDVRVFHQAHRGQAEARNRGVREARGNLIAFLDADDLWRPGKLAAQLSWLVAHPEMDMVFARAEEFLSDDLSDDERRRLSVRQGPVAAMVPGTLLIWRDAFLRAGFFDTALRVGEFVQWALTARDAGLLSEALPDVFLSRRLHRTNTGRRLADARGDYLDIVTRHLARRRAAARPE